MTTMMTVTANGHPLSRMRFVPLVVFLTILGAGDAVAQNPRLTIYDWKTYRYPAEGFAMDFPDAPTLKDPPHSKNSILVRNYGVSKLAGAFSATAQHYRHEVISTIQPEQALQLQINALTENNRCNVRSNLPISITGGLAREAIVDTCPEKAGLITYARFYILGDWSYNSIVMTKPEIENSVYTKRFLESFNVIAR
jgi:hypothetical protein